LTIGAIFVVSLVLLVGWGNVSAAPQVPPNVSITSVNAPSAAPGAEVQYTIAIRVQNQAADSGIVTFTLASQLAVTGASTHSFATPSWSPGSNVVTWTVSPSFPVSTVNFTVTAQVPATGNILGDPLPYVAAAYLCNADGCRSATRNGANTIVGPGILKSNTTSLIMLNNGEHEAVAGETATIVVQFVIPNGTTAYSVTPRVVLQDGLVPLSSSPAWTAVVSGVHAALDSKTAVDGYQLEYAVSTEITQPTTLEYTIQAVRMRDTDPAIKTPVVEVSHSSRLKIQPVLRWCNAPGCVISEASNAPYSAVNAVDDARFSVVAINPLVNTTIVHQFTGGIGGGGGQVRLTYTHVGASSRPTAYDAIFTATLGVSLTVETTKPAYDGMVQVGNTTVLTWEVPVDMASGTSWAPVVTATLPSPLEAGHSFTATSQMSYDTYPAAMLHEGIYKTNAGYTFALEVHNTKTSTPVANTEVTMGNVVTYYVRLEVGPNVILPVFYYTDTLPLGFQLLTPVTVEGTGGVLLGQQTAAGPTYQGRIKTLLGWSLGALPPSPSGYVITSTYTVVNSGLDYESQRVYVSASDLIASKSDKNSVTMYWAGGHSEGPREATIRVIQPTLSNTNFDITRTDSGSRDVAFPVDYQITFRNSGRSPAYDIQICDTLPEGVMFLQNKNTPPNLVSSPAPGAAGKICWKFSALAVATTSQIQYVVSVTDGAMPGTGLDNYAEVVDFSTKPGVVPYERSYADIAAALSHDVCPGCLRVLGFEADKTVLQPNTYPGEYLTYTIAYSNSSVVYTYTNAFIADTYDANLIFVSADPPMTAHDPAARRLQWNLGTLERGAYDEIVVTMRVRDIITDGATSVVNTLAWDSDNSRPHQRQTVTPLWVAAVGMDLIGPSHAHAGETILYTVAYSNTGTVAAPVTITLDYGPYVNFISATPAPVQGNTVFADTVPNDGVEKVIQITLQVKAPLPYQLTQFGATAELQTPGLLDIGDALSVVLDRPIITLDKVAPDLAAPPVPPNNKMRYIIYLRNNGTYTATGVVLTDTWGTSIGYLSDNHAFYGWNAPAPGAGYVTRTLSLGINELQELYFDVEVLGEAAFYTNTVDMTTRQTTLQSDTAYAWSASVATSKSATPVPAFPGRVLTYTVYYTNTNVTAGALTNVRITDTLPSDFTYIGQTAAYGTSCPAGWSFTPPVGSGGEAVWTCASLNNNLGGYFLIWGTVAASAEGSNLVNVTASSATGVPVRPIETPLVTRVARPWLRVAKTVVPTHPVAPGDLLTYTLTYENYGTDSAYNVVITDPLPDKADYVSCSGGDHCEEAGGVVTWNRAMLPVDTVGTVQLVVRVKAGASGQMVNENYTIQSDRLSAAETSNGGPVESSIQAPALTLRKEAHPPVVTAQNQPITYTIYYTNSGGGLLSQVVLTDDLSSLTYYVDAPAECTKEGVGAGGTVTCNLGNLPQGTTGHVQIIVLNIATMEGQEITNVATGDATQITPVASNQTSVFYYGTGCVSPWNPSFSYFPASPVAGAEVTFQGAVEAGNTPLTYTWTFGDSGEGVGQVVKHTYAVSDTYTVVMTVDNPCHDPQTVTRQVQVTGASHMAVSPDALAEAAEEGYLAFDRHITITNTGTADLIWTAIVTPVAEVWLSLLPAGGTVAPGEDAELVVTFVAGLTPDVYTADIRISSNAVNAPVLDVPVTFTVTAQSGAPEIAWAPPSFAVSAAEGATEVLQGTLVVSNTGTATLTWSIEVTPTTTTWLEFTVAGSEQTAYLPALNTPSGTMALVTLYLDPAGLGSGKYTAGLRIVSNDTDEGVVLVPVTFTIVKSDYFIFLPLVLRNH